MIRFLRIRYKRKKPELLNVSLAVPILFILQKVILPFHPKWIQKL
jgi:hypothetical protein